MDLLAQRKQVNASSAAAAEARPQSREEELANSLSHGLGLAAGPAWHLMPVAGLLWLLAGGIAYTAGVAFFRAEGVRYTHFVWHWFVLAGTACHFIAVLRYAGGA